MVGLFYNLNLYNLSINVYIKFRIYSEYIHYILFFCWKRLYNEYGEVNGQFNKVEER